MKSVIKSIAVLFITAVIFTSCKKETATQTLPTPPVQNPPIQNKPPVANAGSDQIIILPKDSVELTGGGTDADGIIVSYEWTKLSGPSQFTFLSNNSAITKVIKLVEGRYEFELKVTDNGGFYHRDIVAVIVMDPTNPDPCYGCWDY
jgi:hypothetical protein